MSNNDFSAIRFYGNFLWTLFSTDKFTPQIKQEEHEPPELSRWKDADLEILIEESRDTLNNLDTHLEKIRNRSQFLLTTVLALSVFLIQATPDFQDRSYLFLIFWIVGLALVLLSILGSAALIVGKKMMGAVHPYQLSKRGGIRPRKLAEEYVESTIVSTETVNAHVTVFRAAVQLLLLGLIICVLVFGYLRFF